MSTIPLMIGNAGYLADTFIGTKYDVIKSVHLALPSLQAALSAAVTFDENLETIVDNAALSQASADIIETASTLVVEAKDLTLLAQTAAEVARDEAIAAKMAILEFDEEHVIEQGNIQVARVTAAGDIQVSLVEAVNSNVVTLEASAEASATAAALAYQNTLAIYGDSEDVAAAILSATNAAASTNLDVLLTAADRVSTEESKNSAYSSMLLASDYKDEANSYANTAIALNATLLTQNSTLLHIIRNLTLPTQVVTLLSSSAVVDVFIYDTLQDSDNGAWVKKANTQSWYWETLNTATRGTTREFPAVALIVAETTNVTIFDATVAGCPMWMVFNATSSGTAVLGDFSNPISSVCMLNGLFVVTASGSLGALSLIDFVKDVTGIRINNTTRYYSRDIVNRHALITTGNAEYWGGIVSRECNDATMVLIPGRSLNEYGLSEPCIAIATAGGVSIIDGYAGVGTVVDDVITGPLVALKVSILNGRLLYNTNYFWISANLSNFLTDLTTDISEIWESARQGKWYYNVNDLAFTIPSCLLITSGEALCSVSGKAFGSVFGATLLNEDTTTPANGMVAHITKDYNTGWMKGDIRRALICETDIIVDGTFNTIDHWVLGSGWYINSGIAFKNVGYASNLTQRYILDIGEYYYITYTIVNMDAGVITVSCGYSLGAPRTASGTYTELIQCTSLDYLMFVANALFNGGIYNIRVVKMAKDRSVKASSIITNGSLQIAPVAAGAELQAISGFSTANYLSQAYSADLDFNTGDFYIACWINAPSNIATEFIFARTAYSGSYTGAGLILIINVDGTVSLQVTDDAWATTDTITSSQPVDTSSWKLIVAQRVGANFELWLDGTKAATDAAVSAAAGSLSNTSATLKIGDAHALGAIFTGSLAMLRFGAGSLSAEQISKMYADEKLLFYENAKCSLQGTSSKVKCLAYNTEYNALAVGTNDGVTTFHNLLVNPEYYNKSGIISAIASMDKMVIAANAIDAQYTKIG